MKQHMSNFINKTQLRAFMADIIRKPWTAEAKLEAVTRHIECHNGDPLPAERKCDVIMDTTSRTGMRCSACLGDIDFDARYCRLCGAQVTGKTRWQ